MLLIFQVQIGNLWVSVTSLIIASAFIFGNTLRIMFETLVRHFSTHPFDVEDKLNVEKIGWCVVKEMTLVSESPLLVAGKDDGDSRD